MICGIILAAGNSSRMGGKPKAILDYEGKTFLETVCSSMRAAGVYDITVVLGRQSEEILSVWKRNCEQVVVNQNPDEGQISSLRVGLKSVPAYSKAAMVALVDQPMIAPGTFEDVCNFWKFHTPDIVIPKYNGKRGHPVIISAAAWQLCFDGPVDKGLHWVTHHEKLKVMDLDVKDPNITKDVDTPEDYAAISQGAKQ